jgi:hypothetical protein
VSEYDRKFWEDRWSGALREHGDRVAQRPPSAHLTADIGGLRPGRALDAGCSHRPDTLWLAARGWEITAVDFAATALAALAALDPDRWELVVAEERPRPMAGTGVDAVIRARRRS